MRYNEVLNGTRDGAACPSALASAGAGSESKTKMARDTSALREDLDEPGPNQKTELARTLIDSLDEDLDDGVEQLWLNETYRYGEMSSHSAVEVSAGVRVRLGQ